MKSLFDGLVRLGDALRPLVLLALRVVIGVALFYAGKGKFGNLDGIVEYFGDLGIPVPHLQAPFIAGLELAGGIAIVAGLGTRVFALLLSCTMVVALLTAHRNELGHALSDFTEVAPLPFLLPLLVLFAFGAGGISVDAFLGRRGAASAKSKPAS